MPSVLPNWNPVLQHNFTIISHLTKTNCPRIFIHPGNTMITLTVINWLLSSINTCTQDYNHHFPHPLTLQNQSSHTYQQVADASSEHRAAWSDIVPHYRHTTTQHRNSKSFINMLYNNIIFLYNACTIISCLIWTQVGTHRRDSAISM